MTILYARDNFNRVTNNRMHIEEQLCFALYSATNAVIRTYRPWLRNIGLTYPQYLVLLVLWQHGERTMGEIATRLALPPGGVTPIVERLEAAKFVLRRRDEHDRRVVHVMLTETGVKLEQAAADAQTQVVCATGMPVSELSELKVRLKGLTENLCSVIPDEMVGHDASSLETASGPSARHLAGE